MNAACRAAHFLSHFYVSKVVVSSWWWWSIWQKITLSKHFFLDKQLVGILGEELNAKCGGKRERKSNKFEGRMKGECTIILSLTHLSFNPSCVLLINWTGHEIVLDIYFNVFSVLFSSGLKFSSQEMSQSCFCTSSSNLSLFVLCWWKWCSWVSTQLWRLACVCGRLQILIVTF